MKTINIYGENRFAEFSKIRNACRGIVIRNGMLLLTYEVNTDQWFIPGGGLEGDETIEACCIRELAEETGYVVNPLYQFATINEYYEEWKYISNYFICEITGETNRVLTQREAEVGLEPRWIPLQEAVAIFSQHQDYAHDEMKRGGYLREYKALLAFENEQQGLLKLSAGELVDLGICPTCFNRINGGALYGDNSDKLLYEDEEIECFFVGNPRADGHMCISTIAHYHDMSKAPDHINEKIVRFAKRFMQILCEVYGCERVYLCTMCDGPNNHYHIQLIPRYAHEKRRSRNFVKERKGYQFDSERFYAVRQRITEYAAGID